MKSSQESNGSAIPLLPLHDASPQATGHGGRPAAPLCQQLRLGSPERVAAASGFLCWVILLWLFPVASTLHVYLAAIATLGTWIVVEAAVLSWAWRKRKSVTIAHWTAKRRLFAASSSVLCLFLFFQGSRSIPEAPLPFVPPSALPLLIATSVHDSAHSFPQTMRNILRFVDHVGRDNVHLSIIESSNSHDATPQQLARYANHLAELDIAHTVQRLNQSDEHDYWVEEQSRDHINRHAFAKNRALSPVHSGLRGVDFRKILFIDPVFFRWTDLVRLVATADGDFDVACGLEWGPLGLDDVWSFRDKCGIRARPTYPYVLHDQDAVDAGRPFQVASCWNGLAAFSAAPFLASNAAGYRQLMLNERKAAVLSGDSRADPGMASVPFMFHATHVEECAASEGMLMSYDLHLLHRPTRPRIFVNPSVNISPKRNWYVLYTRILRRPLLRPWVYIWDRWLGTIFLSAAREMGRPAELCQWQGFIVADGCPPPPSGALGLVTK